MSLINTLIVSAIPLVPKAIVRRFADRYIAGEKLEDAINLVRELNRQGIRGTLDVLGESIHSLDDADAAVDEYLKALQLLSEHKLDCGISLKPSQFGLHLDAEQGGKNIQKVMERAHELGIFLRLDMEDNPLTTPTLDLYRTFRDQYDMGVGTVVQAYLRRTYDDVMALIDDKQTNLRLCKGIYIEPRRIAWKDFDIVRQNYVFTLETALKRGAYMAIATHDEWLFWQADRIIQEHNIPQSQFEFQMLLGVDEALQTLIQDRGYPLRLYVPYGQEWYAYSTRRLRENPKVARYIAENFLRGLFSGANKQAQLEEAIGAPTPIKKRGKLSSNEGVNA